MVADALAISASALQQVKRTMLKIFLVELVAIPSILENIKTFRSFKIINICSILSCVVTILRDNR